MSFHWHFLGYAKQDLDSWESYCKSNARKIYIPFRNVDSHSHRKPGWEAVCRLRHLNLVSWISVKTSLILPDRTSWSSTPGSYTATCRYSSSFTCHILNLYHILADIWPSGIFYNIQRLLGNELHSCGSLEPDSRQLSDSLLLALWGPLKFESGQCGRRK